ncbi:MAG: 1-acyl-sn-glycerol-3-phosphate acyltransferase [Cytophagales bacterium]|nr:1-acyl-sn-glycerol-3-phosphate acyltransferase [Cytophagales bacterium]
MQASGDSYVKKKYAPILPGSMDWPVVQLSKNRKQFIESVIHESVSVITALHAENGSLKEEIEQTRFKEMLRVKQNPWNVDPDDDPAFWSGIKARLLKISVGNNEKKHEDEIKNILHEIVSRYAHEIQGNFKRSRYKLARTLVKFGFKRLLNASKVKGWRSVWSRRVTLQDKIQITGEVEQLRNLAKKGTVIMVPTHFSNLDSILIGWVIHILGLPPFIYGAGLNLFNIGILAYFMNSLGAYKVDRRKKNQIYRETLKTYSKLATVKGCHGLFFPGGTRSRSGKIESKLKLGLLGSAMEAQRHSLQHNSDEENHKVFVVPVVINYHFVVEAPGLINDYLQSKGQERYYVENDSFTNSYKILIFLFKFITKGSDISVSIGRGLDLLGNYVDEAGNSIDKKGRRINIRDYFISNGEITEDLQREKEYTRRLGEVIVKEFRRNNRVFSSHLVAFTAFNILKKRHSHLDLYDLLRIPKEESIISYEEFRKSFELALQQIHLLNQEQKVTIAPHLRDTPDKIIDHGLYNVGMYHSKRPLVKNKEGNLITHDLNTLFYYHNRLCGYGLENIV